MLPVGDLIAHVKEWTGLSSGALLQAVRQPHGVATDAREQFDAVVGALRRDKQARGSLEANEPAARILEQLSSASGSTGAAVREWLRMTGHRLVTGYDICDLTALEMPELLVRTLRASLGAEDRRRAEEVRREHAARVRDAVPERHRAEYDALFAEAIAISNLREERALVLDFWAYGLTRRAVKEAGRRLASRGRIASVDHLFDASHEEMLALLRGAGGPGADELAERYAWRTTATADLAPKQLGFPPAGPPPERWLPPAARRMSRAVEAVVEALFAEPEPKRDGTSVQGLDASAGTYEGRARVVTRMDDFERICVRPRAVLRGRRTRPRGEAPARRPDPGSRSGLGRVEPRDGGGGTPRGARREGDRRRCPRGSSVLSRAGGRRGARRPRRSHRRGLPRGAAAGRAFRSGPPRERASPRARGARRPARRRAARACAPGGSVVVVDVFALGPRGPLAHAAYELHLAMRTGSRRAHAAPKIAAWLEGAGLVAADPFPLEASPLGLGALLARKPSG